MKGLLKINKTKLVRSFDFMICYIDYIISLNNAKFGDYVDRIYHSDLEKMKTRYSQVCFIIPTSRNLI